MGAPHLHVDWQPPAQGDPDLGAMLAPLADDTAPGSLGARIKAANEEALQRIFAADPVWEDVRPAREIWPEMDESLLLARGAAHRAGSGCAAPCRARLSAPSSWKVGHPTRQRARELAASGGVRFEPCHH